MYSTRFAIGGGRSEILHNGCPRNPHPVVAHPARHLNDALRAAKASPPPPAPDSPHLSGINRYLVNFAKFSSSPLPSFLPFGEKHTSGGQRANERTNESTNGETRRMGRGGSRMGIYFVGSGRELSLVAEQVQRISANTAIRKTDKWQRTRGEKRRVLVN